MFDVWVVNVDGAIVFDAGSATRTPINVIQGSWQTSVDEPKWIAICRDLEASAPPSLWF